LERRQRTRYHITAPLTFKWRHKGVVHEASGYTRDISPKGLFIYSDSVPPEKADVSIRVNFQDSSDTESSLFMSARALVIRTEVSMAVGKQQGFAVLNRNCGLYRN
jgi:hypothetical protein